MGYKPDKKATLVLQYPLPLAFLIVFSGLVFGWLAEASFGHNMFERFGALTAGLGVLVFGVAASELLTRSQFTLIMQNDGEPPEPFKTKTVRFALNCQAIVVFIGTMQWGFGALVTGR